MNKKLLFGLMSLAALAACTNDDFETQGVAEQASPIQFEVINNDATMRASMDGTKIKWSAKDGDIFTLYHGGLTQNATYTATENEGGAILTTPSMILAGKAVMVWPVDTAFRTGTAGTVSIVIPEVLKAKTEENPNGGIENHIPYVSDEITIAAYNANAPYNTAGLDRKYPIFMRPMASQLTINADYNNTDATIAQLYDGGADGLTGVDAIDPISVTSLELLTTSGGTNEFTQEIPLTFTSMTSGDANDLRWNTTAATKVSNNKWTAVTGFGTASNKVAKLTTEVLTGNESAKFLILPQTTITGGVAGGAVVVNTIYGKVVVEETGGANGGKYTPAEIGDAWYRYISATSKAAGVTAAGSLTGYDATEAPAATAGSDGRFKTTSAPANGLMQTINVFSTYTHQGTSPVQTEPEGTSATRYLKVLLSHLDMSELHVKTDKQLRDAAKVWNKMGLDDVTVFLDGDANNEFEISQKTIKVINDINASISGGTKSFKVKPCTIGTHKACNTIVITGGGAIQDLAFIKDNSGTQADVVLKAGETWNWAASTISSKKAFKVDAAATGIASIINKGTLVSDATATIAIYNNATPTPAQVTNIPLVNDGTWSIAGATLNVQFSVTNNGTVNIAKGAQYRQDGTGNVFTNEATTLPERITKVAEKIGKVLNFGVFATVNSGVINNYGLIEHKDVDAKTYVTANQTLTTDGFTANADFTENFNAATSLAGNKMGRINLPYSNKNEDNVSVSAALAQGFVSVTVDGEVSGALDASVVGSKVNYVIINSGITEISAVSAQVKYLEINQPGTEIAWNVPTTTVYDGLIVLSDVNIKLGTKIIATTTYLGADMYVGGKFNKAAIAAETPDPAYAATDWDGYYGDTTGNVATKYITY